MAVAMTFRGSRLLARSVTRTILPDKLEIKDGKVHITRRAWFGLKTDEDEIRLERIASVRVKRSILTGRSSSRHRAAVFQSLSSPASGSGRQRR